MRLIDADELIQSIRDNGLLGNAYSYQEREDDLIRKIERRAAQSTAQERPRGHWIPMFGYCECSCCRGEAIQDWTRNIVRSEFCPHCGADMRGSLND